jgi:hypothetical protein
MRNEMIDGDEMKLVNFVIPKEKCYHEQNISTSSYT